MLLKIKQIHRLGARHYKLYNDHIYKKISFIEQERRLKNALQLYPSGLTCDKYMAGKIFDYNNNIIECLSTATITSKMVVELIDTKPEYLARLDISMHVSLEKYKMLMKIYDEKFLKYNDLKNTKLSPFVCQIFVDHLVQDNRIYDLIPIRYIDDVIRRLPSNYILTNISSDYNIPETMLSYIKNKIDTYTSLLEGCHNINIEEWRTEDFFNDERKYIYRFNINEEFIVNDKYIDQEFCNYLVQHFPSTINKIPCQYIHDDMIKKVLNADLVPGQFPGNNIPNKYKKEIYTKLFEKRVIPYEFQKGYMYLDYEIVKNYIKNDIYLLTKIYDQKMVRKLLNDKVIPFFTIETLNNLNNLTLDSDTYKLCINHILLYYITDNNSNPIRFLEIPQKGYSDELYTYHCEIPKNSATYDLNKYLNDAESYAKHWHPFYVYDVVVPINVNLTIRSDIYCIIFPPEIDIRMFTKNKRHIDNFKLCKIQGSF